VNVNKFLFFTDIHFDLGLSRSKYISDNVTKWLNDQFKVVRQIFEYASVNNINYIFFGGDFFEQKNHLDVRLFNTVWLFIRGMTKRHSDVRLVLNAGNHDIASGTRELTITPFMDLCQVVEEPTDYDFDSMLVRVVPFGMVTKEVLYGGFDSKYKTKVLMTHEKIEGLELSSGIKLESKLTPNMFDNFDFVLNGDIHKPQNLGNIINVGSSIILDWSEAGEEKRFMCVDAETKSVTSIPIKCPKWYNVEYDSVNEEAKKHIEGDYSNYYRISAKPGTDDKVFDLDNVSTKYVSDEKKESRLKENGSLSEDIEQYVGIVGEDNIDSLIKRGKELAYDIDN